MNVCVYKFLEINCPKKKSHEENETLSKTDFILKSSYRFDYSDSINFGTCV